MLTLPRNQSDCALLGRRVQLSAVTSTWLSVTAKNVKLSDYVDFESKLDAADSPLEPVCPMVSSRDGHLTLADLPGDNLPVHILRAYEPERGLRDAFETLGGASEPIELMATRLAITIMTMNESGAYADQDGGVHWTLSVAAALYWRVQGEALQAIRKSAAFPVPQNVKAVCATRWPTPQLRCVTWRSSRWRTSTTSCRC